MNTRLLRTSSLGIRVVRSTGILVAAATLLSCPLSCASKPTMEVKHAEITGVGPLGISINVLIKVYNSNSFDIMVRKVTAQATLANQFVMPTVTVEPNVWLPAKETTYVTAPVVVPWTHVPGILAASMGNEYIGYHVKGSADVTATRAIGLQVNNQQLDEKGKVPRTLMLSAARTAIPGAR